MHARYALIRHLLAIIALPLLLAVVVPIALASSTGARLALGDGVLAVLAQLVGVALLGLGATLFGASLYQIIRRGEGTLAPWDPPRRLVVCGPYRRVRNPMISGVIFALFGEALLLLSPAHGVYAVAFLLLNLVYIPLLEEPQLEARFGDEYRRYRQHVSRFFPRLRPWNPDTHQS